MAVPANTGTITIPPEQLQKPDEQKRVTVTRQIDVNQFESCADIDIQLLEIDQQIAQLQIDKVALAAHRAWLLQKIQEAQNG